jgi:hypothetical protein
MEEMVCNETYTWTFSLAWTANIPRPPAVGLSGDRRGPRTRRGGADDVSDRVDDLLKQDHQHMMETGTLACDEGEVKLCFRLEEPYLGIIQPECGESFRLTVAKVAGTQQPLRRHWGPSAASPCCPRPSGRGRPEEEVTVCNKSE